MSLARLVLPCAAAALVTLAACGDKSSPKPEGAPSPESPPTARKQPPSTTPPDPAAAPGGLDRGLCALVDGKLVEEVLGGAPKVAVAELEDTASGPRLRCEWQKGTGIASIRVNVYAEGSFWTTVVASDYGEPFAAWTAGEARRGTPPTGFASRRADGGTVDVSVVGRRDVTDAQLVALAAPFHGGAAPAPTPAAWQPDRSCTQDDDCRPAPSCCPMPCNGDVINRRDLARAEAELKKTCPTTPADCPSAGSCPGHAYLCVEGTCKLVMEGEPGYRTP